MEFKFNVNDIFKEPIVEVSQNLIPPGFSGDRRALWDTVNKVSEVVNAMGEASASAQGLTKPITTAERLRNSDKQKLYFFVDQNANSGKGAVTGMLKTGIKGLYVFDREGNHYQVSPPCVLDFYVHETRQRNGLGKQLFEHMLQKEQVYPVHMALDRPSDKLLNFLNKYYSLNSPVKQMNNYVVFDGFFPQHGDNNAMDSQRSSTPAKESSANGLQSASSPYGRYGAPRPPCSMGQIIHNETFTINRSQPIGVQSEPATNYQSISSPAQNFQTSQSTPNMYCNQKITNQAGEGVISQIQQFDPNLQNQQISQTNNLHQKHPINSQGSEKYYSPPMQGQLYNEDVNQYNNTQQSLSNQNMYEQPNFFRGTGNLVKAREYAPQNVNYVSDSRLNTSVMPNSNDLSNPRTVQNKTVKQEAIIPANVTNTSQHQNQNYNSNAMTENQRTTYMNPQQQSTVINPDYSHTPVTSMQYANQQVYPHIPANAQQMEASGPLHLKNVRHSVNLSEHRPIAVNEQLPPITTQQTLNIPSKHNNYVGSNNNNPASNPYMQYENQQRHHIQENDHQIVAKVSNEIKTVEHPVSMIQSTPVHGNQWMPQVANQQTPSVSKVNMNTAPAYSIPQTEPSYYNPNVIMQDNRTTWQHQGQAQMNSNANSVKESFVPEIQQLLQYSDINPVNHRIVSNVPLHQPQYGNVQQQQQSPNLPEENAVGQSEGQFQVDVSQPKSFHTHSNSNQPERTISSENQYHQSQQNQHHEYHLQNNKNQYHQSQQNQHHEHHPQNNENQYHQSQQNRHHEYYPHNNAYQSAGKNIPHIIPADANLVNRTTSRYSNHAGNTETSNRPSSNQIYRTESVQNNRNAPINNMLGILPSNTVEGDPRDISNNIHINSTMYPNASGDVAVKNQKKSVSNIQEMSARKSDTNGSREEEELLKYGYPPQHPHETKSMESTPKLERPRSLILQQGDDQVEEIEASENKDIEPAEDKLEAAVAQNGRYDGTVDKIMDKVEDILRPTHVDIIQEARKSPSHLTEQGYFDLKFYHNKLW